MSMARIYAIALNTYREAVRDRVLFGVLVLAAAVLALTLALGELSLDQQMRVVTDMGLASKHYRASLEVLIRMRPTPSGSSFVSKAPGVRRWWTQTSKSESPTARIHSWRARC